MKFRQHDIDVNPGTNQAWVSAEDKEIFVFSIPFYETANVVFVRKESGIRAKTAHDFEGKRIGCVLGYYYTDGFQEAFDSGNIIRDDAPTHANNIKKLNAKRVDGVITDQVTGLYIIKQLGLNSEDFEIAYEFEVKSVLSSQIHKDNAHVLPKLNQALHDMQDDGTILEIIEKYTK